MRFLETIHAFTKEIVNSYLREKIDGLSNESRLTFIAYLNHETHHSSDITPKQLDQIISVLSTVFGMDIISNFLFIAVGLNYIDMTSSILRKNPLLVTFVFDKDQPKPYQSFTECTLFHILNSEEMFDLLLHHIKSTRHISHPSQFILRADASESTPLHYWAESGYRSIIIKTLNLLPTSISKIIELSRETKKHHTPYDLAYFAFDLNTTEWILNELFSALRETIVNLLREFELSIDPTADPKNTNTLISLDIIYSSFFSHFINTYFKRFINKYQSYLEDLELLDDQKSLWIRYGDELISMINAIPTIFLSDNIDFATFIQEILTFQEKALFFLSSPIPILMVLHSLQKRKEDEKHGVVDASTDDFSVRVLAQQKSYYEMLPLYDERAIRDLYDCAKENTMAYERSLYDAFDENPFALEHRSRTSTIRVLKKIADSLFQKFFDEKNIPEPARNIILTFFDEVARSQEESIPEEVKALFPSFDANQALWFSIALGKANLAKWLLTNGCDIFSCYLSDASIKKFNGIHAIHVAANAECFHLLINEGETNLEKLQDLLRSSRSPEELNILFSIVIMELPEAVSTLIDIFSDRIVDMINMFSEKHIRGKIYYLPIDYSAQINLNQLVITLSRTYAYCQENIIARIIQEYMAIKKHEGVDTKPTSNLAFLAFCKTYIVDYLMKALKIIEITTLPDELRAKINPQLPALKCALNEFSLLYAEASKNMAERHLLHGRITTNWRSEPMIEPINRFVSVVLNLLKRAQDFTRGNILYFVDLWHMEELFRETDGADEIIRAVTEERRHLEREVPDLRLDLDMASSEGMRVVISLQEPDLRQRKKKAHAPLLSPEEKAAAEEVAEKAAEALLKEIESAEGEEPRLNNKKKRKKKKKPAKTAALEKRAEAKMSEKEEVDKLQETRADDFFRRHQQKILSICFSRLSENHLDAKKGRESIDKGKRFFAEKQHILLHKSFAEWKRISESDFSKHYSFALKQARRLKLQLQEKLGQEIKTTLSGSTEQRKRLSQWMKVGIIPTQEITLMPTDVDLRFDIPEEHIDAFVQLLNETYGEKNVTVFNYAICSNIKVQTEEGIEFDITCPKARYPETELKDSSLTSIYKIIGNSSKEDREIDPEDKFKTSLQTGSIEIYLDKDRVTLRNSLRAYRAKSRFEKYLPGGHADMAREWEKHLQPINQLWTLMNLEGVDFSQQTEHCLLDHKLHWLFESGILSAVITRAVYAAECTDILDTHREDQLKAKSLLEPLLLKGDQLAALFTAGDVDSCLLKTINTGSSSERWSKFRISIAYLITAQKDECFFELPEEERRTLVKNYLNSGAFFSIMQRGFSSCSITSEISDAHLIEIDKHRLTLKHPTEKRDLSL